MAGRGIVTGIPEIDHKLAELEPKVQRKVVRQAMRAGLKLVLAEAQGNVPVLSGLTKDNIKIKAGKRSRSRITMSVRVVNVDDGPGEQLTKTSAAGVKTFYPAVVEYGSSTHTAEPFMRPAYDGEAEDARDTTLEVLLEGTLQEAK